jgi:hypothetical protein
MAMIQLKKEGNDLSPVTLRSMDGLIEHAFAEIIKLLQQHQGLTTRPVSAEEIGEFEQHATMFTVSSSNFRIVILLHYTPHARLTDQQLQHLQPEHKVDLQSYHDYVCELGNNLCGVVCRILGADAFSTGMSTPSLLNISNSALHLRRTHPYCETHLASFSGVEALFSTSFSIFFNDGSDTDLVVKITSSSAADEDQGELEFF